MSGRKGSAQRTFVTVLASLFLAATYVSAGYAVCAGVPFVAEKVAYATIDDAGSPFDKDQLVEGALATRDYSFGSHDPEAYDAAIRSMNAQAGTPYADAADIRQAPSQYAVDDEAVRHLDDVNAVSGSLVMPICGIAAIAAFLLFAGFRMFGTQPVAGMLLGGGAVAIAFLLALGGWALVSFDGFFAAFHSLFFAEGSWTFPSDSLLITMLPEAFWAGMGCTWVCVSLVLAAASCVLGFVLRRRTCK